MKQLFSLAIAGLFMSSIVYAQRPIESSSDILQEIKKLNVVTNVLYVAAHPDDENTRLISWLENEKLARTAYLSLTRGDGGQNLIGTEKGDAMGVLRTQELLEARRTDGGEQFFSRAVDFGYSKTPEETFEKWDKDKILADVVWTIRKFRPDVIITRFPTDGTGGHGHHTASSILAEEAFKLAADPKAYPEQLENVEVWQAKRILWDVYWWNNELKEKAIASGGIIEVNIGDYNELLGLSYSEIAADSRSQHKSQGFGSLRRRGNKTEYLKHTAGDAAEKDLFEGINTQWSRLENTSEVQEKINRIIETYKVEDPSQSLKMLAELYNALNSLPKNSHVEHKMNELRQIIKAAAGIHVEVLANNYNYPGFQEVSLEGSFNIISRRAEKVRLTNVWPKVDSPSESMELKLNELHSMPFKTDIATNPSHPYWLQLELSDSELKSKEEMKIHESMPAEEAERMKQQIESDDFITSYVRQYGMPENVPVLEFHYTLELEGVVIDFKETIDYKWNDRVDGELHRDVIISPEITATPSEKVFIFSNENPQQIDLLIEANKDNVEDEINIVVPEGWSAEPQSISLQLKSKGEQKLVSFTLTPSKSSSVGDIWFNFSKFRAQGVQRIDYPHIRPQILFPRAKAKVVKMDLKKSVKNIGYIIGSGDEVAQNLEQVGFEVTSFHAEDLPTMDLSVFETIMVGIRAYNTEESMKNGNNILNEYVKKGGNVIVQYNTNRGLKSDKIGPYPFKISRKRVTKEEAEPTFLQPKHALLNQPNQLDKKDFDRWVQERGLYFADEWDEKYETIISWNDPKEDAQKGSILVCDYGEGHFIYTGISFFRQLPAGVPGAYRLLTNMISYGK